MVASMWRAAALRNYSVGAWRALWRWLAHELNQQPMTAEELGDRLAAALPAMTVAELIDGLPPRTEDGVILPAEAQLAAAPITPLTLIQQLAVGAGRLNDLDGFVRKAFVGTDTTDLGPHWVADLLHESRERRIRSVGRDLAAILVRRAKRVALSKMYLTRSGKPFSPTRLRDRDGVLSVRGEEGAGDVALRIDTLADILAGLGVLALNDVHEFVPSDLGEGIRARFS
jgi:hypothetical protein